MGIHAYNKNYLLEIIGSGNIEGKIVTFKGTDKQGKRDGYIYKANIETGRIVRIDSNGKKVEFGNPLESNHKRGYVNIEMVVPYDKEIHADTNKNNLYTNKNGEITGVQWTAYIHNIFEVIGIILGLYGNNSVCNHKDNVKFHNNLSNLESVSSRDNSLHGAVVCSIVHHRARLYGIYGEDLVVVCSNKKHDFLGLRQGISCDWIKEYCLVGGGQTTRYQLFEEELERCTLSLRNKQVDNQYISIERLKGFIDFLYNGYWKNEANKALDKMGEL